MMTVPVQTLPNQSLIIVLSPQQLTQINLRQRWTGLFVDVLVDNNMVVAGVIAENNKLIVRNTYLGYVGDLFFYDTNGNGTDLVDFTGLGSRWILLYMSPTELAAAGLVY